MRERAVTASARSHIAKHSFIQSPLGSALLVDGFVLVLGQQRGLFCQVQLFGPGAAQALVLFVLPWATWSSMSTQNVVYSSFHSRCFFPPFCVA